MEEVDNIIIESLRNLNCDIEEDITSLKQFNPDLVTTSISCCLKVINPEIKMPQRLPSSMSLRLKVSSQIVEHIKSIGFRGDLGYQTILYSNEVELRRVLMFLIERIPRENPKVASAAIGYVPRLVKEIEEKVRQTVRNSSIPRDALDSGGTSSPNTQFQRSFGNSSPLRTEKLQRPNSLLNSDAHKRYWVHILPEITKQCSKTNLVPSLIFKENEVLIDKKIKLKNDLKEPTSLDNEVISEIAESQMQQNLETFSKVQNTNNKADQLAEILKYIETKKDMHKNLQEDVQKYEYKLNEVIRVSKEEENELEDSKNKLNIKMKTLTVLSKEENLKKLKLMVEKGNEKLVNLASQWNEVQTPLIEQYQSLQNSISQQELKYQMETNKLTLLKNKVNNLEHELGSKDLLEKRLIEECQKLNKVNSRAGYTKRILEIIGNIKKQDGEIGKILKDTKDIQKEINQLTGQLDRCFTLSDALIFKDAKFDEAARNSYKLLATLHIDCESIIQSITDIGLIERENRNLQDQIDAENDKDMTNKLKQVISDIEELKQEQYKKE